jgi:SseB protein N-terminal domain
MVPMNEDLLLTLRGLKKDPALAVHLHQQLFTGRFFALVADPTEKLGSMSFLTYPTSGELRGLPVFTTGSWPLLTTLKNAPGRPQSIEIEGKQLWPRLLDLIRSGEDVVEVDPGEAHGIRLTREMILGMVSAYSAPLPAG